MLEGRVCPFLFSSLPSEAHSLGNKCLSFIFSFSPLAPGFLFPLLWLSRVIEYPELNILLNPVAQTGLFPGDRLVSAVDMKPRLADWGGQDGDRLGT